MGTGRLSSQRAACVANIGDVLLLDRGDLSDDVNFHALHFSSFLLYAALAENILDEQVVVDVDFHKWLSILELHGFLRPILRWMLQPVARVRKQSERQGSLITVQGSRSAVGIGGTLIQVIKHTLKVQRKATRLKIRPPYHTLSRLNLDTDSSFFGFSTITPSTTAKRLKAVNSLKRLRSSQMSTTMSSLLALQCALYTRHQVLVRGLIPFHLLHLVDGHKGWPLLKSRLYDPRALDLQLW